MSVPKVVLQYLHVLECIRKEQRKLTEVLKPLQQQLKDWRPEVIAWLQQQPECIYRLPDMGKEEYEFYGDPGTLRCKPVVRHATITMKKAAESLFVFFQKRWPRTPEKDLLLLAETAAKDVWGSRKVTKQAIEVTRTRSKSKKRKPSPLNDAEVAAVAAKLARQS